MNSTGMHIRFLPGAVAQSMVSSGAALAPAASGKVREISLVQSAAHLQRIGNADGRATGIRFYRWRRLDESASRIVEHHPRSLW